MTSSSIISKWGRVNCKTRRLAETGRFADDEVRGYVIDDDGAAEFDDVNTGQPADFRVSNEDRMKNHKRIGREHRGVLFFDGVTDFLISAIDDCDERWLFGQKNIAERDDGHDFERS